jgi:HAD superfamily hydrolase (TIGR01490 family)
LQLVFFDLDGTITRRDTLLGYVLGAMLRRPWRLPRLLGVLPTLWKYVRGRVDRGELKGRLIHCALGGLQRQTLERWTAQYVPRLLARGVFTDARYAIEAHRSQQDHLVLMSASVDLYVPAIGRALGFTETVCSAVRWDGDRLDGRLDGPNCRDERKAAIVRQYRERFPQARSIAYGNSTPDLLHLDLVDQGWCVNARSALRAECERRRITVIDWR